MVVVVVVWEGGKGGIVIYLVIISQYSPVPYYAVLVVGSIRYAVHSIVKFCQGSEQSGSYAALSVCQGHFFSTASSHGQRADHQTITTSPSHASPSLFGYGV